ncbi:MAG: dTMP kinase [Epsilonproteobacteria bacterium]|nr:dTMP kinase [Campylobacterota bacterium]
MYVALEGIDGVGKSTQIEILKSYFPEAIFTKEPGGTKFGERAREILLYEKLESKKAELFLFLADRAEHFKEVIEPNLDRLIISDRSLISGIAYAIASNPEFELEFLIELNRFALDNRLPQKVVFFKINIVELVERLTKKVNDNIEKRGFDYLLKIQDSMLEVIKRLEIDYLEVDATNDISSITKQIVEYLG